MSLCVKDIANDLGVLNITVWRWIDEGRLKATMIKKRFGYRIDEADYMAFLDAHPKYKLIHNREAYNTREIKAREEVLKDILEKLAVEKGIVESETHSSGYLRGFSRAVNDITAVVNLEMRKRLVEDLSRSEQSA